MLQQMDYVILDSKRLPIFSLPLSQTERIIKYMTSIIYITLNIFIVFFSVFKFAWKPNTFKRNEQDDHLTNEHSKKWI